MPHRWITLNCKLPLELLGKRLNERQKRLALARVERAKSRNNALLIGVLKASPLHSGKDIADIHASTSDRAQVIGVRTSHPLLILKLRVFLNPANYRQLGLI